MSNPLTHLRVAYHQIRQTAAEGLHHLLHRLKAAWQQHLALMNQQESYRAQVVAGVAAVVAVFELDPMAAAVLATVLGLHAAAYGRGLPLPRSRPVFGDDEEGWDPLR